MNLCGTKKFGVVGVNISYFWTGTRASWSCFGIPQNRSKKATRSLEPLNCLKQVFSAPVVRWWWFWRYLVSFYSKIDTGKHGTPQQNNIRFIRYRLGTLALVCLEEGLQTSRVSSVFSLNASIVLSVVSSLCTPLSIVILSHSSLALWIINVVFPKGGILKVGHAVPPQWKYWLQLWQKIMITEIFITVRFWRCIRESRTTTWTVNFFMFFPKNWFCRIFSSNFWGSMIKGFCWL